MGIVSVYTRGAEDVTTPKPSLYLRSTRQKVPYTMGIPFEAVKIVVTKVGYKNLVSSKSTVRKYLDKNSPPDNLVVLASNAARSRLMGKLTPARASMAVNLAQLNQSVEMIAMRSGQLLRAYRSLRKGNLPEFFRILAIHPDRRQKKMKGNASSTWLEYTFGWVPLLQDIHNATQVLDSTFDIKRELGRATLSADFVESGSYANVFIRKKVTVSASAGIRVTNPNLALANTLGLINPAAVVWDIIPFSFVVDWFLKINKYTATLNDMAGFSFVDPVTTIKHTVSVRRVGKSIKDKPDDNDSNGTRKQRLSGVPVPVFVPRIQLPMPSLWMAATSTSLLYQVFSKK